VVGCRAAQGVDIVKSVLFTRNFWLDAAERAIKTAAQSALLVLGQDVLGFDVFSADWLNLAGFAAGGAMLSVLTSIASAGAPGISPASAVSPGA
jgi:hypothetical protein